MNTYCNSSIDNLSREYNFKIEDIIQASSDPMDVIMGLESASLYRTSKKITHLKQLMRALPLKFQETPC